MTLAPSNKTDALLTPAFIRQLERLDVLSRKVLAGKLQGERRSKKRGRSVEFADYRPYVEGDDLRFIDWNLFARLDRLFLRLFMEEEDLALNVLVDVSASMDYGEPGKLRYARQLAAALGYIGLTHYNRVTLASFADTVTGQLPNLRGRRPVPQMLDFLEKLQAQTGVAGDLPAACKRFVLQHRARGIVVIISDFLEKGDLSEALRYFAGDRFDVYAIQVLAPQEIDPAAGQIIGDLRLRDVEDNDIAEVTVTAALLNRYKANLEAWCHHVRDQCLKRGIAHMISDTSVPFETLVLRYLRERGLVG
jgi:uncharacterized protein (DUF58 family)